MAKIRRCFDCKVVFPTIDAVNYHYKLTSHKPLPYKCESTSCERVYQKLSTLTNHILSKHPHLPVFRQCECCKQVFKSRTLSTLLNHLQSEHPHLPLPYSCEPCQRVFKNASVLESHKRTKRHLQKIKTPVSAAISNWNPGRDDDDRDTDASGRDSPENVNSYDAYLGDPILAEKHPSAVSVLSTKFSIASFSEPILPAPSSSDGPCPSKLDEATALARAALRSRFAKLGVSDSDETTLSKYNIWGSKNADLAASDLDGSCSIPTELSPNSSNWNEHPLNPLDPLDNTTHSFMCPGCRMDFKSFSGFVLHIEARLCKSSMCHEIEDQINACATQLFNNLKI